MDVGPLKDTEKHLENVNGSSYGDVKIILGWNGDGVKLAGSSLVSFRKKGYTSCHSEIFRVSFHTAFIGPSNTLVAGISHICPESLRKDMMFSQDTFKVIFEFEDYCDKCFSHCTEIKDICENCRQNEDL